MNSSLNRLLHVIWLPLIAACSSSVTTMDPLDDFEQVEPATILEAPAPADNPEFTLEETERGRYLVQLLGCGSCHTNGAIVGEPRGDQLLAGSDWGIAYSNPLTEPNPGVVYPANLTPDPETGIGDWSVRQLVTMIQTGVDNHGGRTLPVMPWPAYVDLRDEDARAIAAYLKSLAPVRHRVPDNVAPGEPAQAPYVHFGVYRSRL